VVEKGEKSLFLFFEKCIFVTQKRFSVFMLTEYERASLYVLATLVNIINVLRGRFFVQNFGAKNKKAGFWVQNVGTKNVIRKMHV
jgi:hypothetical protein